MVDAAYCRHPVESQLSILATSGQQQLVQQQAESCPHIYHNSPGLSGHKTLVSGPGQSQESYGPVSYFDLWKLLGEVEIFVEAVTRGGKTRN